MECPKCNGKSAVIETRRVNGMLRRRRKCLACSARFTSIELVWQEGNRQKSGSRLIVMSAKGFADVRKAVVQLSAFVDLPADSLEALEERHVAAAMGVVR